MKRKRGRRSQRVGRFDAVIHNAGVYQASPSAVFFVNTIAPYLLTGLIHRPRRLIYLSSSMHLHGRANLESFTAAGGRISYSDSKLHVVMLCMAAARKWPDVYANAVDPGWVPTKMGGRGAPDDLDEGYATQTWLAVSDDPRRRSAAATSIIGPKELTIHRPAMSCCKRDS
jgi:NAD(P)-dependent dehydrogenase (short-subunit alcohol dehydrogenase family)